MESPWTFRGSGTGFAPVDPIRCFGPPQLRSLLVISKRQRLLHLGDSIIVTLDISASIVCALPIRTRKEFGGMADDVGTELRRWANDEPDSEAVWPFLNPLNPEDEAKLAQGNDPTRHLPPLPYSEI